MDQYVNAVDNIHNSMRHQLHQMYPRPNTLFYMHHDPEFYRTVLFIVVDDDYDDLCLMMDEKKNFYRIIVYNFLR